jgi:hypothetical protein
MVVGAPSRHVSAAFSLQFEYPATLFTLLRVLNLNLGRTLAPICTARFSTTTASWLYATRRVILNSEHLCRSQTHR